MLAEWTGLEPATPGVTGRYSNQLNYHSRIGAGASASGLSGQRCAGVPTGIRTPVIAVKGRCPRPLDDGDLRAVDFHRQQKRPLSRPLRSSPCPEAARRVLAEWTGLEPATPGVTGRYSNQLNYHSMLVPAYCFRTCTPAYAGVPTGIRTPVIAVKGRCPRPLDDGDLVVKLGASLLHFSFAPRSETLVEVSGIEPLTSCMPCKRSPS